MEKGPEITKLYDGCWSLDEENVRFFLLEGKTSALLIDSGMLTKNAREVAETLTKLPLALLNTHADMDHIRSNGQFDEVYMNPAEGVNYYKQNHGTARLVPVWDGELLDLGDRPLKIIYLPGHTPGSIAVLDIKNRALFSGDPVQDGTIFMFGPLRDFNAYIAGLERLNGMADEFDAIYPSHGTRKISPDIISKLVFAARGIQNGIFFAKEEDMFGKKALLVDAGTAGFLCDPDKEMNKRLKFTMISAKEAKETLDSDESFVLVDARDEDEFERNHIKGAVLLPHDRVAELSKEALPDKEKKLLIYCRSGRRSKIAAALLAEEGYKNIFEFGGIIDWPYEIEGELTEEDYE